jgi:RNA polymerase sigma-70 factor (ECF subfamily)
MNRSTQQTDFVDLLSRHRTRIFGYIVALVQNTADAEDLFQQASMILWKKFDQYDPERSFPNWACTIARFEVMNFIRRERRSRVSFNEELLARLATVRSPRCDRVEDDLQDALANCLLRLSDSDHRLVHACYGDRFSIKQAAEQIGRPVDSVYKSLNRIRRALLQCVTRKLGAEGSR